MRNFCLRAWPLSTFTHIHGETNRYVDLYVSVWIDLKRLRGRGRASKVGDNCESVWYGDVEMDPHIFISTIRSRLVHSHKEVSVGFSIWMHAREDHADLGPSLLVRVMIISLSYTGVAKE